MSHIATMADEWIITDVDAAEEACLQHGGVEFRRNQKTWKWYGHFVGDYNADDAAYKHGIKPEDYGKGEHAIAVKGNTGAYEIGLVENPNGEGFVAVFDFWSGGYGLEDAVGRQCEKIRTLYSAIVAKKQLKKVKPGQQPWMNVKQFVRADGKIVVQAMRP